MFNNYAISINNYNNMCNQSEIISFYFALSLCNVNLYLRVLNA